MQLKTLNVIIIIIFFSLNLYSQDLQKKYKIAGISVEGNEYIATETIIAISGLTVGESFNFPYDEKITSSIKRLWQRKQFRNVNIIAESVVGDNVYLLIQVEEKNRLSEFKFDGNSELSNSEIKKATGLSRGDLLGSYELFQIKDKILKLYDKEGLGFAQVEINTYDTDTNNYKLVDIYIKEGVEFKVSDIDFIGNVDFTDDELAGAFKETKVTSWYEFWKSSKFKKKDYEADLKLINHFLKEKGYLEGRYIKDTLIYDETNEKVKIQIDIFEGKKYFIRNIDFRGNTVFSSDDLKKRLEFDKGDIYNVIQFDMNLNLNQEQTDAKSLYNNSGYLFAEFRKSEKIVDNDSVDITIDIFENDRAKVRKVNIIGNDKTKDKVIRRELYIRPGDYFNRAAIIRSVNALNVLGYFNPESLRPDVKPVQGDNTAVDIEINVEEKSTDTFNASFGFAGSFGLTGSLGFSFNNFSMAEPLRGGGGEVFNLNAELGFSQYRSFSIGYTQPWLFDKPITLGGNLFSTSFNYGMKLRRTGGALNIGKRLRWPDDYFRINGSLRIQQNDVELQDGQSNSYYRNGKTNEVTIGSIITRISIDNQFFATTGSKFTLTSNFALGAAGLGNTDYFKNELSYDMYNPIMKVGDQDRVVLYIGTRLGHIWSLKDRNAINPIEVYRMGGNGLNGFGVIPLRGYDDRAISDGGRTMAKFTSELRFAISLNPMPVFFYGFAEAGNVWDDVTKSDPLKLNRSAGVGLQMFLNPIGIIGVSYGYGFDPTRFSAGLPGGWKFLLHLGNFN